MRVHRRRQVLGLEGVEQLAHPRAARRVAALLLEDAGGGLGGAERLRSVGAESEALAPAEVGAQLVRRRAAAVDGDARQRLQALELSEHLAGLLPGGVDDDVVRVGGGRCGGLVGIAAGPQQRRAVQLRDPPLDRVVVRTARPRPLLEAQVRRKAFMREELAGAGRPARLVGVLEEDDARGERDGRERAEPHLW